ncbi:MAG: cell division protein FtsI, partial [Caldilineaceae bacterium]|nr:cell division protein FtsI [Caldilineaceae bacterium]
MMEPKTGAVLGLANFPTFDPNRYSDVSYERYANPAISAQYEPGSIFKIITMAAGLDSGLFQPTTIFSDTGWIIVGGRSIFNSDRMGHGDVTATEALVRSLNVVTAQVAVGLGPEKFYSYVRRFGFGQATEVDLS